MRVVEGVAILSASCSNRLREEESFWRLFERQDVDLQKRAIVEGFEEDQSQVAVVLQHLRPILEAYWVLLYAILRPIYWTVVEVRVILTDWDDPGATILALAGGLWMWWTYNVLFGILLVVLAKLTRLVGSARQRDAAQVKLRATMKHGKVDPKQMLLEYGEARKALFYGRVDPLSYKVLSVEQKLKRLGTTLVAWESAFLEGDRPVCLRVFGALIGGALSVKFLPVFDIATLILRSLFLFVLLYVSLFVPVRRRLPLLFPGLSRQMRWGWERLVVNFLLPIRLFISKRFRRIEEASRDPLIEAGEEGSKITNEEWMLLCKEIGKKYFLARGEHLGTVGDRGQLLYRLVAGEVLIKGESGIEVTTVAPATLLGTNVLIGHGRQSQEFVAHRHCVAYEIRADAFRFYLVSHPNFAKNFWASMAVKVSMELKYWVLTAIGGIEAGHDGEDGASLTPVAESVLKSGDMSAGWISGRAAETELLRQIAKEYGVSATPQEMDVFTGVKARAGVTGIHSDRYVEGIFIFAKTHCIFHALDRRHHDLDFCFALSKVETTKLTPARRFRVGGHLFRLKITVAAGNALESVVTGGAASAMRGLVHSNLLRTHSLIPFHYYVFSEDGVLIKRIMRNIIGRLMLVKGVHSPDVASNLFGPSLLGVEMTAGVEHIDRLKMKGVELSHEQDAMLDQLDELEDVMGGAQEVASRDGKSIADVTNLNEIFQRRSEIFSDLDKMALEKIAYKLDRFYKAGAEILSQGKFYDSVFLILDGTVELQMYGVEVARLTADDKSTPLLGSHSFIMGEEMRFSAIARTPVTVRVVDRATMEKLVLKEPSFGSRFYEMLVYDLCDRVTRIWLAYLSRDDWGQGVELIARHAAEKGADVTDQRRISEMTTAFFTLSKHEALVVPPRRQGSGE